MCRKHLAKPWSLCTKQALEPGDYLSGVGKRMANESRSPCICSWVNWWAVVRTTIMVMEKINTSVELELTSLRGGRQRAIVVGDSEEGGGGGGGRQRAIVAGDSEEGGRQRAIVAGDVRRGVAEGHCGRGQ